MSKMKNKVSVITGGASGIGEAAVRLFVKEHGQVVIADIDEKKGKPLAEELGMNAVFLKTDVAQEADVKASIDEAIKTFGHLDCVFNNAGMAGVRGGIAEISLEGFDHTLAVLFRGVFLGMKHAAPIMKSQGFGSIINTASIAGLSAGYGPHIYSAAKAAVIHLTKTVSMEMGEHGVRVNCICPGGIATPIFGKAHGMEGENADKVDKYYWEHFKDLHPIPRTGLPNDIAHAALWLASDDSTFVNGHALTVDGGVTGGRKWSDSEHRRQEMFEALGLGD